MMMVRTFAKETKSDHISERDSDFDSGSLELALSLIFSLSLSLEVKFFSCARDTRLEYYLKLRFCWRAFILFEILILIIILISNWIWVKLFQLCVFEFGIVFCAAAFGRK